MFCPNCAHPIQNLKTEFGYISICNECFGHYYGEQNLYKFFSESYWKQIKSKSTILVKPRSIPCPKCKSGMQTLKLPLIKNNVEIDICNPCHLIWFDKDEIEDLDLRKYLQSKLKVKKTNQKSGETIQPTGKVGKDREAEIQYLLAISKLEERLGELKIISKNLDQRNRGGYHSRYLSTSLFPFYDFSNIIGSIFSEDTDW
ncbi:zf-TFIIB domain-containing protein [Leptospira sp. 96542]|nr:zf-TFIIB domain-containing protein [Leptospira sp. 96542]